MYKLLFFFVFINIVRTGQTTEAESLCKNVENKLATLRLKRNLFCDYDPSVRPSLETIEVAVQFIPKFVDFSESTNSLNFHTWVILTWNDPHLHWNPEEYDNVGFYHAKTDDVWVPDFSVFNSGDLSSDQSLPSSDCILLNNGTVQCAVAQVYTTHCPADFANWPYDIHNCTLHFGSWMHFSNEIDFDFGGDGIMMHEFVQNNEWDVKIGNLSQSSEIYHTEMDAMIFMTVSLRRHPTRASVVFITPMIVLTMLTLTVLYLDCRSLERMAVSCSNFICHLICLFDLHWYMPSNGAISTPKILVFYEASIGIATFTLIFTSVVRKIYAIRAPAPQFISTLTASIINFPASQYLGINVTKRKSQTGALDDTDNEQGATAKDQVWLECASILEWLAFVTISLTYIILLAVLLPSTPRKLVEKYIY